MKFNSEMDVFEKALQHVLQVSKVDMQKMLDEEKQSKIGQTKRGPKPKPSAHASHDD